MSSGKRTDAEVEQLRIRASKSLLGKGVLHPTPGQVVSEMIRIQDEPASPSEDSSLDALSRLFGINNPFKGV